MPPIRTISSVGIDLQFVHIVVLTSTQNKEETERKKKRRKMKQEGEERKDSKQGIGPRSKQNYNLKGD